MTLGASRNAVVGICEAPGFPGPLGPHKSPQWRCAMPPVSFIKAELGNDSFVHITSKTLPIFLSTFMWTEIWTEFMMCYGQNPKGARSGAVRTFRRDGCVFDGSRAGRHGPHWNQLQTNQSGAYPKKKCAGAPSCSRRAKCASRVCARKGGPEGSIFENECAPAARKYTL